MQNFKSSNNYIITPELELAIKASIIMQRPLLVKGEPGTGKTLLANEIAKSLNTDLITWYIKSSTKAQQGLYEYDAVSRLRDSQLGNEKVSNIKNYIIKGKIWQCFEANKQMVLLIDEIDKADIEFPNDLLIELDKMEFFCYETQEKITAKHKPIIIITSNNEKELPDAFLRRCFFHYITFPNKETMRQIINVHFPNIEEKLVKNALEMFFKIRDIEDIKKKPSTSELIDWLKILTTKDINFKNIQSNDAFGALLKNEQDLSLIKQYFKINKL